MMGVGEGFGDGDGIDDRPIPLDSLIDAKRNREGNKKRTNEERKKTERERESERGRSIIDKKAEGQTSRRGQGVVKVYCWEAVL